MSKIVVIQGGSHTDARGTLQFMNDLDMSLIKRFYVISHPDINVVRGWRGHRVEQRWFYVTDGEFAIQVVKIDNWSEPSKTASVETFILSANANQMLHVPSGYATLLKASVEYSKVVVFADYGIENARLDDHLWPSDYFN